jgi:hypothetical protein
VDAYGESEQVTGFYTMMENDLRLPFETKILGTTVIVEGIDITEDDQLVAVCRKDKSKQRISLSGLPLPSPLPKGGRVDRCVSTLANGQNSMSKRVRKRVSGRSNPWGSTGLRRDVQQTIDRVWP